MSLPILFLVLLGVGVLTAIIGSILLIVSAFRRSVLWGLFVLFAPLGNVVYTCVHWAEAKAGFLLGLAGALVCVGAVFTLPDPRTALSQASNGRFAIPFLKAPEKQPAPVDFNTQIAEKRKLLEESQAAFAAYSQQLPAEYKALEKRRAALKPEDQAAVAKFNEDAAAYQAKNKRQRELQQEIAGTQAALDQLLDARSRANAGGNPAAGRKS